MSCTPTPEIYLDQDWEFEYTATRKNASTGAKEAATGLTMTAHFAAEAGGSALGSTSVNLSERGTLGIYYGVCAASTLTSDLATYEGGTLWEVYVVGSTPVESREILVRGTKT